VNNPNAECASPNYDPPGKNFTNTALVVSK